MASRSLFPCLLAACAALSVSAMAAPCIPLKVGYMDQDRPPFWLGRGETVPEPPGAAVDLIREAVAGAGFGCPPTLVRLPVARLRLALQQGDIDMTTLGQMPSYPPGIALPRDKAGNIDNERAMQNVLIVLVRAADKIPAGINPQQYFKGKVLGAPQGATTNATLRGLGLTVDDGARDLERNLEKLRLGRIDGVVASTVKPEYLDGLLARYHGEVVRLPQPLVNVRVWLAFNQAYYRRHREQVEALWTWLDVNRGTLGHVMQKYR
ncbi:substrate-binding periplasmic protein [Oxalobacteraceae bacterium A2-2]